MKKVFLKDAFSVFTLANGKKCGLMANLECMVEDVVGKSLRLANEEEKREMGELMEENLRFWHSVEQQRM